ncbi:DUF6990 domain-containing protein, partial [Pseudomonas syringae]
LGFVPYVTSDMIDRALMVAQKPSNHPRKKPN